MPRRRKRARKRRRRARRKGERGRIVEIEIALDLAVRAPPIGEMAARDDGRARGSAADRGSGRAGDSRDSRSASRTGRACGRTAAATRRRCFGAPIEVTASYIRPAMMRPSSGGRNQRERTNSDSFWRTSKSLIARSMPVVAAPQITGLRNHLLQAPARVSGDSRTDTSALSSQRSRSAPIGRSWLSARASMVPLMPPADAPAMMSTTTRSSSCGRSRAAARNRPPRCRIRDRRGRARRRTTPARAASRSAIRCSALDARTSFRISLLMPCM